MDYWRENSNSKMDGNRRSVDVKRAVQDIQV